MRQALRSSRDLRLLVAGELVSRSGTAASFVAVWAVAVYEFGVSPATMSVLALCNTLPRVLTSTIAGGMVDRHGPRVVLIVANALGFCGSMLQWASPNPVALGAASIVAGAGFGTFRPAIGSMGPRVVVDKHLLAANSVLELCWQIGFIVGPLAGAASIIAGGTRAPLLFDAATFVVGIAFVLGIRLLPRPIARGRHLRGELGERAGFMSGLRYTWSLPVARFVMVLNTGSWLGISFFIVLEPLFVDRVLGAGPVALGLLQTAFGVGAVAGAVLASRSVRWSGAKLSPGAIAICGAGMIAYTATNSVGASAAGVALWGVGIGLWAPLAATLIHRGVPVANHGRVNGVMSSLQSGLEVLPVLAAGQLAAVLGIQSTLIAAGVTSLAVAAWGFTASKRTGKALQDAASLGLPDADLRADEAHLAGALL